MSTTNAIEVVVARDMTLEICAEIFKLLHLIWPPHESVDIAAKLDSLKSEPTTHFIVRDEKSGQVRAHALLFPRTILTASGAMTIGALCGVCVHPSYRGRGLGVRVARAALDYLPKLGVEFSLFQTPIPQFYEKLGCRIINNAFFDGTRADGVKVNPFKDESQMIYPASSHWPDGEIDLNGPDY